MGVPASLNDVFLIQNHPNWDDDSSVKILLISFCDQTQFQNLVFGKKMIKKKKKTN